MERYTQETVLGHIGFGKTYLAANKDTGEEYAMKAIDVSKLASNEFAADTFSAQMFEKWRHPNLVTFIEGFLDSAEQYCAFISEHCQGNTILSLIGGNLTSFIENYRKKGEQIPEKDILAFIHDVLLGLTHLHRNGVIHKDLKPNNLFMESNPKIGDYMLSTAFKGYNSYPNPATKDHTYMSPELLKNNECNPNTDTWSLGCIAYEMCSLMVREDDDYSHHIREQRQRNRLS